MRTYRYLDECIQLQLNLDACIGCGHCVTVCPHRVFALKGKSAKIVDYSGCMECGACVKNCPTNALFVNPDEGCGCATLILNSWVNKYTGRKSSSGCC